MAEAENTQEPGGAFIAERFRMPSGQMQQKDAAGDIWAGTVAILAFVVSVATLILLYLDMTGLQGA